MRGRCFVDQLALQASYVVRRDDVRAEFGIGALGIGVGTRRELDGAVDAESVSCRELASLRVSFLFGSR